MAEGTVELRPAGEGELAYVEGLLEEHGLPSRDVPANPGRFYVGYDGDERVGVGGLERYGAAGLLRSLVVEPSARGGGIGTAMCGALEEEARLEGVASLYLLTTTAAGFFAARGYAEIDRADAPEAIRRTTEFDELCPASAVCMEKSL
jgi:amino-acid N-acetyltransferase